MYQHTVDISPVSYPKPGKAESQQGMHHYCMYMHTYIYNITYMHMLTVHTHTHTHIHTYTQCILHMHALAGRRRQTTSHTWAYIHTYIYTYMHKYYFGRRLRHIHGQIHILSYASLPFHLEVFVALISSVHASMWCMYTNDHWTGQTYTYAKACMCVTYVYMYTYISSLWMSVSVDHDG